MNKNFRLFCIAFVITVCICLPIIGEYGPDKAALVILAGLFGGAIVVIAFGDRTGEYEDPE